MHTINKKGQSTVEYVLLVAAVIAVMITFTVNQNSGGFRDTLNTSLGQAATQMSNLAERFAASDGPSSGSSYTGPVAQYNVNPGQTE